MRLVILTLAILGTIGAAYAASLPEPNILDLRILATYSVVMPDGVRLSIDNASLGHAIAVEVRAQQAAAKARQEPVAKVPGKAPEKQAAKPDLEPSAHRRLAPRAMATESVVLSDRLPEMVIEEAGE